MIIKAFAQRSAARVLGRAVPSNQIGARPRRHEPDLSQVMSVDDPDGSMRILAVRGIVEATTVDAVERAIAADDIVSVHLDLSAVCAWMPGSIGQLERALDTAELRGVRLRVIGLDPQVLTLHDQLSA